MEPNRVPCHRLRKCQSEACRLAVCRLRGLDPAQEPGASNLRRWQRDTAACLNLLAVAEGLITTNRRPKRFRRPAAAQGPTPQA